MTDFEIARLQEVEKTLTARVDRLMDILQKERARLTHLAHAAGAGDFLEGSDSAAVYAIKTEFSKDPLAAHIQTARYNTIMGITHE